MKFWTRERLLEALELSALAESVEYPAAQARELLERALQQPAPPEAEVKAALEIVDDLIKIIKSYEDASLRLDTGEIKRSVYKIRAALQSQAAKSADRDLIELARWIDSAGGCVSEAEKQRFFYKALKFFSQAAKPLTRITGGMQGAGVGVLLRETRDMTELQELRDYADPIVRDIYAAMEEARLEGRPAKPLTVGEDARKAARQAIADLIKEAALLAQGAWLPSMFAQDYRRKVPKWMLRELERTQQAGCFHAQKIKQAVDILRPIVCAHPAPAVPQAAVPDGWKPIEAAPKDGTEFWAWLNDMGILKMRWSSPEDFAELDGGDPSEYIGAFVLASDPEDDWRPQYWLPLDALPPPPVNEGGE